MRMFLSHDSETGQLMLVLTDYYNGQHERTAYTVINDDGTPVRRGQEFDGLPAYRDYGGYYRTRRNSVMPWVSFEVESAARETVRTACRKAGNARRKCALCEQFT